MRKKILIVNREQYGFHIDTYKYCEYLNGSFNITYLGWEQRKSEKIPSEGVIVKYISREGNMLSRYLRFLKEVNTEVRRNTYDLIFLVYFPGSSIIKLLNRRKKFNIDIRSCATGLNKLTNRIQDLLLRVECMFFKNVSIISNSLAEAIKLERYHLLPLGGERFSNNKKSFESLKLLYVGSLFGRNIMECVKGFHKFLKYNSDRVELSFTIIGDSPGAEKDEICHYIIQNNLEKFIKVEGYIHNTLLHRYFEEANIGIAYIPRITYFDNQPPTKTFEYLVSGLPVIATTTKEHIKIISEDCGILIDDNKEAFAAGIHEIFIRRNSFDSELIKYLYKDHLWKNIVERNLKPYLIALIQ